MIVTALFIGKNSLGYKNGQVYTLLITQYAQDDTLYIINAGEENTHSCPYGSITAFRKNWKVLDTA